MRPYLRAVLFCREHGNDSPDMLGRVVGATTPLQRGFEELKKRAVEWPAGLPKPDRFPATLKEFLRLIVKAKTPADCMPRLLRFLREGYSSPPWRAREKSYTADEAEVKAYDEMQAITEADKQGGYFTKLQWLMLASEYRDWWRDLKSAQARESAAKRKSAG